MGASVILSIFLFIGGYKLTSDRKIHPVTSALLVTLLPFALTFTLRIIYNVQLFSLSDAITLVLQSIATLITYRISLDIDSLKDYFLVGIIGLVVTILLVPRLVQLLPL